MGKQQPPAHSSSCKQKQLQERWGLSSWRHADRNTCPGVTRGSQERWRLGCLPFPAGLLLSDFGGSGQFPEDRINADDDG